MKRVKYEGRIEGRFGEKVTDIKHDSKWSVVTDKGTADGFDAVVNALWEGRPAIDAKRGPLSPLLSYRYRVSEFVRIDACDLPNFVIATGPFGDFKTFGNFPYLSWYPTGLLVSEIAQFAPEDPRVSAEERLAIRNKTINYLAEFVPGMAQLKKKAHAWNIQGG